MSGVKTTGRCCAHYYCHIFASNGAKSTHSQGSGSEYAMLSVFAFVPNKGGSCGAKVASILAARLYSVADARALIHSCKVLHPRLRPNLPISETVVAEKVFAICAYHRGSGGQNGCTFCRRRSRHNTGVKHQTAKLTVTSCLPSHPERGIYHSFP